MLPFVTLRYPPMTPQKKIDDSLVIRVTNKAIEPLFFCIVHSIEFQTPLQPLGGQSTAAQGEVASPNANLPVDDMYVRPEDHSSSLLGNVTYVSRSKHNPSVLSSLGKAVESACAIQIPENCNEVPFELHVRILLRQRKWIWNETSTPILEWVFRMIKTREEFSLSATHGDSNDLRTVHRFHNGNRNARNVAAGGGPQRDGFVYANDPETIRKALHFILKHSYDAIDINTFSDFTSGELQFDISAQKVS